MQKLLYIFVTSAVLISCHYLKKPPVEKTGLSYWENTLFVKITSGWIQGQREKTVLSFKGIPYASPPVGSLRWKAPRPPREWKGIYQATEFRGTSPQFLPFLGWIIGEEDCLYLNIWRPATKEQKLPIYVWIHGGGNSIGSSFYVPDYDGANLAQEGNLIFVSLNYRLGPFGWFSHPSIRTGTNTLDDSGNYGTLDIIFALKWIQSNILAFGGDPSRVTIAGSSAGGLNVLSLLISSQSQGLFHRAVVQSGYTDSITLSEAETQSSHLIATLLIAKKLAHSQEEALHILSSLPPEEIQRFLYHLSAKEILSSLKRGILGMTGNTHLIADGTVLPKDGFSALEKGYTHNVPLIIGCNKEETKLFLSFSRKDWNSTFYQALARFGSLRWKATFVDAIAETLTSHRIPVYVYRFDWGALDEQGNSPLGPIDGKRLGAFHLLEIPFWLGNDTIQGFFFTSRLFTRKNQPGRKALSRAMMRYLIHFVHTGNLENIPELPNWPKWRENEKRLGILFDATTTNLKLNWQTNIITMQDIEKTMKNELPLELEKEIRKSLGLTNNYSQSLDPITFTNG